MLTGDKTNALKLQLVDIVECALHIAIATRPGVLNGRSVIMTLKFIDVCWHMEPQNIK